MLAAMKWPVCLHNCIKQMDTVETLLDSQLEHDFHRVRTQALRNVILGLFRRRPATLLPFTAVKGRLHMRAQRDLGIRSVPLDQIVGSEGRFGEFDRAFNPRSRRLIDPWKRIGRARYYGEHLPPVELFKVGDIYFVRDGNHRLSVARALGQTELDAHVVEIETNVPLPADLDEAELERKAAQSHFVEEIGLLQVRPGAIVPREASDPGTYEALRRQIDCHQQELAREQGRVVSRAEAVLARVRVAPRAMSHTMLK